MRILVAHCFYRVSGGEDRYVRNQLELLGRYHDVELIGPENSDLKTSVSTAARAVFSPKVRSEVEDRIASFRPDIVHLHNAYPSLGPAVHLAAGRAGVPMVMTVHNFRLRCPNGYMFTQGELCRRCEKGNYGHALAHRCFPGTGQAAAYAGSLWTHRFVLRLSERIAIFIAPSKFMQARLADWGYAGDRTALVPNFVPVPDRTDDEPGEFGAFVGRISPEKGLDVLLPALAAAENPPFKIVGGGPSLDEVRAKVRSLRLSRTEVLGEVPPDQVDPIYRGCRFLVMPSLCDENAPLAVLEAMARGRPGIVSDRGGLAELAADGAGVVVASGDVAALADAISAAMTDPSAGLGMGIRARARIMAEHGPDQHRSKLERVYERALASG